VIAEGIESEHQAASLVELGCDLGQGFLLARPMPVENLRTLLA
jgi:EAL domain-containing protein (putative c-di-GMP-specific phosphodiesterase class I)